METIMKRIAADCSAKQAALKAEAHEAHDVILSSQGSGRVEMHVLREKALGVIEQALECKGNRLAQDGLDGLLFLLRDNQLHSLTGAAEELSQGLPMQVLSALSSLPSWTHVPNIQCHCLTITLQLICSSTCWVISSEIVTTALELCLGTFAAANDSGVKMASRASASQIVTSYCTMLYKEQVEDADLMSVFEEVTSLLTYAVRRLASMAGSVDDNPALLLAVDAVLAILIAQSSPEIANYEPLATLVWKELSPALIGLLGLPTLSRVHGAAGGAEDAGRGASAVGSSALFGAPQVAKSVYTLCGELLRLFGSCGEMRSVLESLFHRLFLFPPPEQRGEVLASFKRILAAPPTLLAFFGAASEPAVAPHYDPEAPLNLNLWKIVIDSLVECSRSSSMTVVASSMEVCESVLGAWASLCESGEPPIPPSVVDALNARFKSLRHAELPPFAYPKGDVKPVLLSSLLGGVGGLETAGPTSPSSTVCPTPAEPVSPTKKEEAEEEAEEEDEGLDEAMRSVAERIGSALRRLEEPERDSEEGPAFRSLQDLVREERRRACCLDGAPASDEDRNSAQILGAKWRDAIPKWNALKSVIEVDEALQKFASEFCTEYMREQSLALDVSGETELSVINADAVYLATLGVLRLGNQLNGGAVALSEGVFVRAVVESGCVVYAREAWLRAVYQESVRLNLREQLTEPTPLLNMILDYEGRELLRDVQRLEKAKRPAAPSAALNAVRKLARHVLTASWEGLMRILSGLVELVQGQRSSGLLSGLLRSLGRPDSPALRLAEGLTASLLALQRLAALCNWLKLQSRSGWIFRQLVEISCPLDELRELSTAAKGQSLGRLSRWRRGHGGRAEWSLRVPDVLSIEILLTSAIQAGSHSPECWKHAIRCCEYVWELERFYHLQAAASTKASRKSKTKAAPRTEAPDSNEWDLGFEEAAPPPELIRSQSVGETAADLISTHHKDKGDKINPTLAKRLMDLLLQRVDDFLEDTSGCLNLGALESFLEGLIMSSQSRVLYASSPGLVEPYRLLDRLSATMVRAAKGARPLGHLMRLWPRVAAHFVECACSRDAVVANRAVSCLHECISALLQLSDGELDGFHFHQLLLSPLQNILCLDLCELGTQDAIVCTLAELLESHASVIRSGWKPVFGALKAVRAISAPLPPRTPTTPELGLTEDASEAAARDRMQRTVLDLFETFLAMEDWEIFNLAALDSIACLIRYLQAPAPLQAPTLETEMDCEVPEMIESEGLYIAALACIRRLHLLLGSLFPLNKLPAFHLLHRLKLREQTMQWVDTAAPGLHLDALPSLRDHLATDGFFARNVEDVAWLDEERGREESPVAAVWGSVGASQRGVLEAWLTLLEGIVGAVATCPRGFQAELLRALHDMLESLQTVPGQAFGDFCLRHSVLPMVQQWLRRESGTAVGWRENSASVRNFKQAVGLLTQLVVDYAVARPVESEGLISDLLAVLVECVGQASEVISRLGSSCLKHFVVSAGPSLSTGAWDVVCRALWKAT